MKAFLTDDERGFLIEKERKR